MYCSMYCWMGSAHRRYIPGPMHLERKFTWRSLGSRVATPPQMEKGELEDETHWLEEEMNKAGEVNDR